MVLYAHGFYAECPFCSTSRDNAEDRIQMIKPKLGSPKVVYRNRFQTITHREADFGAFRKEYFVNDTGRRVGVIVEGPEGILLTRQYRLLIDDLSWEIPGGRMEENEDAEAAARRECAEETGVQCLSLHPLIQFHPGLDTYHNPTQVFFSREFEIEAAHVPDPQEVAEKHWVRLEQCFEMIKRGEIKDSLSLISLFAYQKFQPRQ